MAAKFHIDAVFTISGRGTVLQGTIVEGEIFAGMNVIIPGLDSALSIGSVEGICGRGIPRDSVGLILRKDATAKPEGLIPLIEGKTVEIARVSESD